MKSFDVFMSEARHLSYEQSKQKYEQNAKKDEATDWWSSLPMVLEAMGKAVNRIKTHLTQDEISHLRVLYRNLKSGFEHDKETQNYVGVTAEKEHAKEFLKALNDAVERTHLYVGITRTRPRGSPYTNRMGGRWVSKYQFVYGENETYKSYSF